MKIVLLLISAFLLSSCASKDDQALAGPSIKEQRKEQKQREEFAKSLPPPR